MKFFNILAKRKKILSHIDPPSKTMNIVDENELKILLNFRQKREIFVDRISAWNIGEIEERLAEYEAEAAALKSDNEIILSQIFEEKISQLKEARRKIAVNNKHAL